MRWVDFYAVKKLIDELKKFGKWEPETLEKAELAMNREWEILDARTYQAKLNREGGLYGDWSQSSE